MKGSALSDSLSNVSHHLADLSTCNREGGILPWQEGGDEAGMALVMLINSSEAVEQGAGNLSGQGKQIC